MNDVHYNPSRYVLVDEHEKNQCLGMRKMLEKTVMLTALLDIVHNSLACGGAWESNADIARNTREQQRQWIHVMERSHVSLNKTTRNLNNAT